MKSILLPSAAVLCIISTSFSQAPPIQWQKTIGGTGAEYLYSLQQTADKGYILGGYSVSDSSGDKTEKSRGGRDYWVVKLDAADAVQWQKTIGGSLADELRSVQQTADGGYLLGGNSRSNISGDKIENSRGGDDYWVVKLDATGAVQWQKTIGGNLTEELRSVQQTADGGYILGGSSSSAISGEKTESSLGGRDYWVVKLDAAGTIQWQKVIGGSGNDALNSLQQTADGGYILGGSSSSNISGDKTENSWGGSDYWMVKLDAAGAIQWQKTIGGSGIDNLRSIKQTADGGYILGGESTSNISGNKTENSLGAEDYWVLKLDATGAVQWQNTIGGSGGDFLHAIQQTADGGYILGGASYSNISGNKTENGWGGWDYWVVKLNVSGDVQWQSTIGGDDDDELYSLQQTADGGYILGGASASNISGNKTENSWGGGYYDYWAVKLGSEIVSTGEAPSVRASIKIYPNPTADEVFVQSDEQTTLCLRNAFGQALLTQTVFGNGKIDLSALPNGVYFLTEIETGFTHKILKI